MERGFRDVFVDLLDTAGQLAVQDRFAERASERSEGPAEFANPATVTQPVNRTALPSGEPIPINQRFTFSPVVLAVGGVSLLALGLILARVLK